MREPGEGVAEPGVKGIDIVGHPLGYAYLRDQAAISDQQHAKQPSLVLIRQFSA
jgi:hypothetical protein